MKEILKLVFAIGVCQSAGLIGSVFTAPAIPGWYEQLAKSALTPPGWVFGPVWFVLYTLMGISLYLVWRKRTKEECQCATLGVFFFQLTLNVLWSYLFFGLREPLLGLVGIAALFLAILATVWQFWNVSRAAAYLLVPYILWAGFAAYLNLAIWQLNS
ncbi:MAG: TspO protein [Candidatus Wildermuthbacteria bacterium RIFCSPLOWO2_02_FULL_47_9c]|uniref:TspO and MBR like protein n=2 Tax=Parcubacteria group TaxID=1794811 RepID=A0A837IKU7_9BACT|nr:MAG: TspO and MBR like protein [Candidatus Yanofskybacteria bacterium GW2011_GWC1_48_11]KKW04444.1 MAG: TspO and MBR like protein [Parcubacteria group bacterium GW2011_GWB1_49_12]KKW08626.1 MAG: TspO and MBR like protein [Parcubacteria group bacterium GW2011_GWA1_49_26]KKW13683.1 MAG: TspO and MBR like protein [Parcubacteria group bacterium GW2011_GWA2_50_10]OHA61602.1 MAG: TspO protein [Candidatus Wildermuthbacteria bacterium GWA1_49_26]OHA65937.1 MAG: TspO protein [Candidatus Wildermuthba